MSWLPNNFDKNLFFEKYNEILNPDEFLSEKLKKYKIFDKNSTDKEKSPKYIVSITEAKQSFNNAITVFKLKNEVIEKIKNTKIEKMPNEIPEIFTKPFIIETIDTNETLFADINSITGYFSTYSQQIKETKDESGNIIYGTSNVKLENNEKIFSLLIHSNNKENNCQKAADDLNNRKEISGQFKYLGYNIFEWQPFLGKTNWEFSSKEYNRPILMENNFCQKCEYSQKCKKDDIYKLNSEYKFCFEGICDNIMSFITILNYMLKAENTPIVNDNRIEKINRIVKKRNKLVAKNENWIIKYLYIDKKKIQYENNDNQQFLDKDGLIKKNVQVKGHLRHQAYGVGFKERKWIYIESFITTKWVKEGDKKIIVNLYKENN